MVKFLRLTDVQEHTGLSGSTIYRYMQEGLFPQHVKIGKRSVAWRSDDVDAWLESKLLAATGEARHDN